MECLFSEGFSLGTLDLPRVRQRVIEENGGTHAMTAWKGGVPPVQVNRLSCLSRRVSTDRRHTNESVVIDLNEPKKPGRGWYISLSSHMEAIDRAHHSHPLHPGAARTARPACFHHSPRHRPPCCTAPRQPTNQPPPFLPTN
jgi:hypothetical protein